jgi:hypothetical protein
MSELVIIAVTSDSEAFSAESAKVGSLTTVLALMGNQRGSLKG